MQIFTDPTARRALLQARLSVDAEIQDLRRQVEELESQIVGIDAALQRFSVDGPLAADEPVQPVEAPSPRRRRGGQAQALLEWLTPDRGPRRLDDIISESGLDSSQVRSALSYLRRQNLVDRVGPSMWTAVERAEATSVDAEAASDSRPTGEEGGGSRQHPNDHDLDHPEGEWRGRGDSDDPPIAG